MVLVVDEQDTQNCISQLQQLGEKAWQIGRIVEKPGSESVVLKP
jgi:phosphoribosylaminoimidazole (AIR) synthetase